MKGADAGGAASGRLYVRVSSDLVSKIADGLYPVGARLPPERELAKAYGVSRPTVREAIIALQLDGLVEVRVKSGVYVVRRAPVEGSAAEPHAGPFEILEARHAVEGEACALAADGITDDELARLSGYVEEMARAAAEDVGRLHEAYRTFHFLVAEATRNGAMAACVQTLWNVEAGSNRTDLLGGMANSAETRALVEEHLAILDALRMRSPGDARRTMRSHLAASIERMLHASELHKLEQARARAEELRRRYGRSV